MFGSVLATLVVSPVVLGIAWVCMRRYNPPTRLAAWRHDRPYRSAFATLTFATAAALVSAGAIMSVMPDAPCYEYLWSGYLAVWVPWLLALRAAAVEQLYYEPTYVEV
jgi:DNA-binding transcriptional LysR family regulator